MKKMVSLLSVVMFVGIASFAQTEKVIVRAGEDLNKAFSIHGLYRLKTFERANAYFTNGKAATAKFNYNYALNEMQYIDAKKGDTLALANPEEVSMVQFDGITFYYNEGFVEVLGEYDSISIGMKQKTAISYEKTGTYGQTITNSSILNETKLVSNNMSYDLTLSSDVAIKKETTWYLIGNDRSLVKADKNGFKKLYPKHAEDINSYFKQNKNGFANIEAVKQLLVICLM